MAFLVLTQAEIERLLPMEACIEVMADALAAFQRGELNQPLRTVYIPQGATGAMAWMPAYRSGEHAVYGMKILCVIPDNPKRGLHGHQGAVVLMDGLTGELRALMDASAITAIRTAAVSAVATRLLAREDSQELAIVGSGVQARWHLESIPRVRSIRRVRVASRTQESARRFVEQVRPHFPFAIEAAESIEAAVRGADIVVTATTAREPVLERAWLAPGTHINAIGASQPTHREIDTATLAAATLIVDRRESVENEAGEYRLALQEGVMGRDHIKAELGELLLGSKQGRTSTEEVTLFRSLGLAVEDVAAAQYLLQQALMSGTGSVLNLDLLGGFQQGNGIGKQDQQFFATQSFPHS
jgi:ornithine cyclodeaminase